MCDRCENESYDHTIEDENLCHSCVEDGIENDEFFYCGFHEEYEPTSQDPTMVQSGETVCLTMLEEECTFCGVCEAYVFSTDFNFDLNLFV